MDFRSLPPETQAYYRGFFAARGEEDQRTEEVLEDLREQQRAAEAEVRVLRLCISMLEERLRSNGTALRDTLPETNER